MTDASDTQAPSPSSESPGAWTAPLQTARAYLEENAFDAAVLPLRQAVELAHKDNAPGPEASSLGLLGQLFIRLGRGDEAVEAIERALQLAMELEDTEAQEDFRALLQQANMMVQCAPLVRQIKEANHAMSQKAHGKALSIYEQVVKDLPEENHHLRAQTLAMKAQAHCELKQPSEAELAISDATKAANTSEDQQLIEQIASLHAVIHGNGAPWAPLIATAQSSINNGELNEAVGHLEQAIQLTTQAKAPGPEASARGMLAVTLFELHRAEDARSHAIRAKTIAKELGDPNALRQFSDMLQYIEANLTEHSTTE